MKIIIASQNPVKINCTLNGFGLAFPKIKFEIEGIKASSEVSDQPMSDEEALRGATNRANNAYKLDSSADYYVGIESGIQKEGTEMITTAWVVVRSKQNKIGKGRTASFFLPAKVVELINQGKELGEADDIVFKKTNSKQENGASGLLTHNIIDRTKLYTDAVVLALIPFMNPELYP